jgi:hypothetical protein
LAYITYYREQSSTVVTCYVLLTQATEAIRDVWLEKTFTGRKARPGEPAAFFSRVIERPLLMRQTTMAHCGVPTMSLPFSLSDITRLAISRLCTLVAYLIAQLPPRMYSQEDAYSIVTGVVPNVGL